MSRRTESYISVHRTDPGKFKISSKLCLCYILYMKAVQVNYLNNYLNDRSVVRFSASALN